MADLIEFPLEGGGSVMVAATRSVQTDGPSGGSVFRGGDRRDVATRSSETMQQAIGKVKPAAAALAQAFSDLPMRPESVEVNFGIQLDAELGAVIASTAVSAHFEVRLIWSRSPGGA